MADYFFNTFPQIKTGVAIPTQTFSKALPPVDCSNGMPVSKYDEYGENKYDVLYSIWSSYQNTQTAQFTTQQSLNAAPVASSIRGPKNIFIFRHGEKNSGAIGYHLNNNGIYRACELVDFMNVLAKQGYPISYIVTINPCPYNTKDPSMRPEQTIAPASFMLGIPTYIYGDGSDYDVTANELYNGIYDGLNVVLCWEHATIQPLCLAIVNAGIQNGRISQTSANQFFVDTNPCPDGNYIGNYNGNGPIYTVPPAEPNGDYQNSEDYPYWTTNNFDSVYWFNSTTTSTDFSFNIFEQPCVTCYASCNLHLCLYQPPTGYCEKSNHYYDKKTNDVEDLCELPTEWQV